MAWSYRGLSTEYSTYRPVKRQLGGSLALSGTTSPATQQLASYIRDRASLHPQPHLPRTDPLVARLVEPVVAHFVKSVPPALNPRRVPLAVFVP